jgi:hypothetical protein
MWNVVGMGPSRMGFKVPPILDCLQEDGSMYHELKEKEKEAHRAAAAFVQAKTRVLGKRSEDDFMEMEIEDEASSMIQIEGKAKKNKSLTDVDAGKQVDGKGGDKILEATGTGSAGPLVGADDRASQGK